MYWKEWMAAYPGLPNIGNIAFMKILGYVDLPGVTAPTEIAATSGLDQFHALLTLPNGAVVGYDKRRCRMSNRQSFTGSGATPAATPRVAWRW